MKHRERHPEPVDDCWACKVASVQFNTSAGAASVTQMEKRWDRDMPAYKRLRNEGLQPKSVDGAGDLETRANERFEIEMGHLFSTADDRKKAKDGMAMAKEMSLGL